MEILNKEGKLEKMKFEPKIPKKKVDFEFQQIGIELEPYYGKAIWPIFYKFHLEKIKDAHKVCTKKGITNIKYLIGVMKKLK